MLYRCHFRCTDLLLLAEPFWEIASYGSCQHLLNRQNFRNEFSNEPLDKSALDDALNKVPDIADYLDETKWPTIEERRCHLGNQRNGTTVEETNGEDVIDDRENTEEDSDDDAANLDADVMGLDPYASDYSYDECQEFVRDPIGYMDMVYGRSKEDFVGVPRSESTPEIVILARDGKLDAVKSIVDSAAAVSHDKKMKVVNSAGMQVQTEYWREELKVFKCFGATPLIAAAFEDQHEIVQYLLMNGADPTLKGCTADAFTSHSHINALDVANKKLGCILDTSEGNTKDVMKKCSKSRRCVDLLTLASYFWEDSTYSSCGYDEMKRSIYTLMLRVTWLNSRRHCKLCLIYPNILTRQ